MRKSLLSIAVLSALALPTISFAADAVAPAAEATPEWTVPMNVGFVSDYIFRGQSQSWGKPSVQGGIELDHKSGLYAGLAFATVSANWLPGASYETDIYGGFRNSFADTGVGYDVGGIYYAYPSGDWNKSIFPSNKNSLNTFEVYAALSYKFLSVKAGRTLTEYFGWNLNNSGVGVFNTNAPDSGASGVTGNTKGSYFYEANAAYEVLPTWTVSGQLGRQIIAESTGLDWTYYKLGMTKAFANSWSVGGFYSGTSEPAAYKNFASLSNAAGTLNNGGTSNVAKDQVFLTIGKSF
ncbi:MAG: hypothetical protein RLZZ379_1165 [Pseudomonadota bacterium]